MDDVARRGDRGGRGLDGARPRHRPGHAEALAGALGSTSAFWMAFIALFVGGWALQFVGHHYEGKRPALLDNIFQGFIGPMFLVAESLVVMGQRSDLADAMGEGDVTVR